MTTFSSIDEFLGRLRAVQARMPEIERKAMEQAGEHLVAGAQTMLGEEIAQWPPLADSTVEQKAALGYTGRISPTDPLYRTGELRASIAATVQGHTLTLGTADPIAVFQEFGTSRMPPRPFIGATMFRDGKAAGELVAEHMVAAIGFRAPKRRLPGPLTGR